MAIIGQFDPVRTGHWTEQKQAILLHAIPRRCRFRWHNALDRTELSKTFKDNFYIISACHDYGILYFVMQFLRSIPSVAIFWSIVYLELQYREFQGLGGG